MYTIDFPQIIDLSNLNTTETTNFEVYNKLFICQWTICKTFALLAIVGLVTLQQHQQHWTLNRVKK